MRDATSSLQEVVLGKRCWSSRNSYLILCKITYDYDNDDNNDDNNDDDDARLNDNRFWLLRYIPGKI